MQVQDIQDTPMEINYTLTEPVNDYYSDIYSPWQTKLQLEIWQEVRPEKVNTITTPIIPWNNVIPTKSKNIVVDIKAVEENSNYVSYGIMRNNMNNQTCRRPNWSRWSEWYIYDIWNGTKWKIVRVKPWYIYIEAEWNSVYITITSHNLSV